MVAVLGRAQGVLTRRTERVELTEVKYADRFQLKQFRLARRRSFKPKKLGGNLVYEYG